MFTGLIEAVGEIAAVHKTGDGGRLELHAPQGFGPLQPGESIAVNGACITVDAISDHGFSADLSAETLRRTTFGEQSAGEAVNLERALRLGDRLGGHMVAGHIDEIGTVRAIDEAGGGWRLDVQAPESILALCVEKGSIAIDGISLTIAELMTDGFACAIIPVTWRETNLSRRKRGDRVNLETDLIGKYVQRLLSPQSTGAGGVTWETLKDAGFI